MYISTSKLPLTCTVKYDAGNACRRVEVGVIGERNDSIISSDSAVFAYDGGAGMEYVRLVVEASYVAPRYVGKETLKLQMGFRNKRV